MISGAVVSMSAIVAVAAGSFQPAASLSPLRLLAKFDPGVAGQSDPLVTSGRRGEADFLFIRFLDPDTAVFAYDSWGVGGPISKPVKVAPNVVHHLEIDGPMLTEVVGHVTGNDHLRVVFDGAVVFDSNVSSHVRDPERIYFGWNPIGGTSCSQGLHGSLEREDGQPLCTRWSLDAWKIRLADWWKPELRMILLFLLLSAGVIFVCEKLHESRRLGVDTKFGSIAREFRQQIRSCCMAAVAVFGRTARDFRQHICFGCMAAVAVLVFSYMVTDGDFRFDFPESFGSFYDFQAASLLHGHLDVPREAIGGEAFIVHGKSYGYYGPTPAAMRMPFVILKLAFGKLSRTFMLLDYIGCLVFAYIILRLAVRMLRGENAVPSNWAIILLIANAGLGSTLLFLGGRAFIYHEAILCGAAFAIASCYFSLRHLIKPEGKAWMLALACGLLSENARPTAGIFSFSFLGCAALAVLLRSRFQARQRFSAGPVFRVMAIGAMCVVGMASYNVISYLKFGTLDVMPLKYNVQFTPARLAVFEGKTFHLSNLACTLNGYLWGPNFKVWPTFPYFFAMAPDRFSYPNSKMDWIEIVLGMPYAMSGLFFLAIGGSVLVGLRAKHLRWALVVAWGAVVPLCLALFTAVAISQRYTGDFCPFLIVASAFGLAAFEEMRLGATARTVIWMLTLWSILATLALTFDFRDGVFGIPDEAHARYQRLRSGADHLLNLHADAPPR